jgi:hypothetical protein
LLQVLMFDADVVPMRDPTYMFEDPQYKAHGGGRLAPARRLPPRALPSGQQGVIK